MNSKWLNITMSKVRKFVRKKKYVIILSGCIIGCIFTVSYWGKSNIIADSEKYYNATLEIETEPLNDRKLYKIDFTEAMRGKNVCDRMKEYLGGYEKYDYYIENICIDVEDNNKLFLNYEAYSDVEANKVLIKLCNELENEMKKEKLIKRLTKIKYSKEEKEISTEEKRMEIYYMMEMGTLLGMVLATIFLVLDFILKDYISDEIDIYEYFNKPVLAKIPPAKEKLNKEKK